MTANLLSEIKPEQFANDYDDNWSNSPPATKIEENNEFAKHMNNKQRMQLSKFNSEILDELAIKRRIFQKKIDMHQV
jgi:hypothetical protein